MRQPLTVPAVLLLLLGEGPAYGSSLLRRFAQRAGGRTRLAPGRVYPALKQLRDEGLVRAVRVAPRGRRGGRTRIYYALSRSGSKAAIADRNLLLGLLAPRRPWQPSPRERGRMGERLREGAELSEAAATLSPAER